MLTSERKQLLLRRLQREGRLEARTLATELGVSNDTIRRDLRELAAAGKLQRVHGGALPKAPAEADLPTRQTLASDSKRTVGATAASLIEPGQVVIIDAGTTALQLVAHLPAQLEFTAVTHSPTVAVALAAHQGVSVVMIGGKLFRHSMVNVGAAAVAAVSHIRADTYFMGVTGVDVEAGLSTGDLEEAHIKQALSQRSADTVVLASEEKLSVASAFVVMPIAQVAGIVVDSQAPAEFVSRVRAAGCHVFC